MFTTFAVAAEMGISITNVPFQLSITLLHEYLTFIAPFFISTGGHPENWNMIVSNCLLVIDQSKQRFDQANIQEIRKNQIKTGSCLFNPNQSKILSPGS